MAPSLTTMNEVVSVDDHLENDVVACERGLRDAGVAMGEGAHRVEEMRDGPHAAVECRGRSFLLLLLVSHFGEVENALLLVLPLLKSLLNLRA